MTKNRKWILIGLPLLFPDGHTNWYVPLALGLNCIAVFLNLVQMKKNREVL